MWQILCVMNCQHQHDDHVAMVMLIGSILLLEAVLQSTYLSKRYTDYLATGGQNPVDERLFYLSKTWQTILVFYCEEHMSPLTQEKGRSAHASEDLWSPEHRNCLRHHQAMCSCLHAKT